MAISGDNSSRNWNEIERSESYLVCGMFEEAASLASSIIKQLCENLSNEAVVEDTELNDMLESAGMVFVQSFRELGRTSEILKELKLLFGSVTAIPVQVFITGACLQIQEGPHGAREYLEEYLSKWRYVDERYYVLASAETDITYRDGCSNPFVLGVDEYLQVVEVYAVTFLTVALKDMNLAISWVENAALPEKRRQVHESELEVYVELVRRIHSIHSSKVSSHTQGASTLQTDDHGTISASRKELNSYDGSLKEMEAENVGDGENSAKLVIMKFSERKVPCLWWFRTINLRFGNAQLIVSNGSVLLGSLILLMCFLLRKKRATLTRFLKRQALSVKKAAMDLWQLAFSYQVNPLAAVESLPTAMHGSR